MNRTKRKQFAMSAYSCLLQTLPRAQAGLWLDRLAALRFMEVNGFLPPLTPHAILDTCRTLGQHPALAPLFGEALPLPDCFSGEDGLVHAIRSAIPAADWLHHPEMTGWLMQYRNTDEKERIFADLRNRIKISAADIPAATQMFTPDWIVAYLTENAIGHLWLDAHPDFIVPDSWQYFLPDADPASDAPVFSGTLTSLTVLDPCAGTGHILAHAFDVLMDLYRAEGYAPADAARSILRHNLSGADIDSAACRLASFVLLMKARRHDPEILESGIVPAIHDCARLPDAQAMLGTLIDLPFLHAPYDVVITNPPYMGSSSMNAVLRGFVRQHYPDSKSDLFAVFMERCAALTAAHGHFAMITPHSWMFLSSFTSLRERMQQHTLRSLLHLGAKAFSVTDVGTIVRTAAFVARGCVTPARTLYLALDEAEEKTAVFFEEDRRFCCTPERFSGIPGQPLCYWISDAMLKALQHPKLSSVCRICQGMTTSDNRRFLRYWFEVPRASIAFGCRNHEEAAASGKRWFPYNKGGKLRKWYGNNLHIVNYENNGEEMRAFHAELNRTHAGGRIKNADMFFRPAVTWPFITEVTRFGVRRQPAGFLFDVSGSSMFPDASQCGWLMGLLCSRVALEIMKIYNPTMNFQVENVGNLPIIWEEALRPAVERLVAENIAIAQAEWDSFALSWDFETHPLVQYKTDSGRLADAFAAWDAVCEARFARMRANEEALNRIFLRLYGLEDTLSPVVEDKEITLRRADASRDIRSLLDYAVGCAFGRYGGRTSCGFLPLQGERDACTMLESFLCTHFGRETLEENLRYIAVLLDGGTDARAAIRRYFRSEFYTDHCRSYRRRPIFWMADSGRHQGFRALVDASQLSPALLLSLAEAAAAQRHDCEAALSCSKDRTHRIQLQQKQAEAARFEETCIALAKSGAVFAPDDGIISNFVRFSAAFARIRT